MFCSNVVELSAHFLIILFDPPDSNVSEIFNPTCSPPTFKFVRDRTTGTNDTISRTIVDCQCFTVDKRHWSSIKKCTAHRGSHLHIRLQPSLPRPWSCRILQPWATHHWHRKSTQFPPPRSTTHLLTAPHLLPHLKTQRRRNTSEISRQTRRTYTRIMIMIDGSRTPSW